MKTNASKGRTLFLSIQLLQYDLPEPVSGKVGVWSKTDSVSYFEDFTVNSTTE